MRAVDPVRGDPMRLAVAGITLGLMLVLGVDPQQAAPVGPDTGPVAGSAAAGRAPLAVPAGSPRPVVSAGAASLVVNWQPARRCRIWVQVKGNRPWRLVTTGRSPTTLTALTPGRSYSVRLRCRLGKRWARAGKASGWVVPLAGPAVPPVGSRTSSAVTVAGPAAPQPGTLPARTATGTKTDSGADSGAGAQPPPGARVTWVDPGNSDDTNPGRPPATDTRAWGRNAASTELDQPTRVEIRAESLPEAARPTYWEHRQASARAPTVLATAAGPAAAIRAAPVPA